MSSTVSDLLRRNVMIGVVQRVVELWYPKLPVVGHASWPTHFRYLSSAGAVTSRTSGTRCLVSAVPAHTSADARIS